jgi:hypothetical protein
VNKRSDVRVSKICAMRLRKCCSQSRLTPDSLRSPTLSAESAKRVKRFENLREKTFYLSPFTFNLLKK